MPHRRHAPPEQVRRVSLSQIALELGIGQSHASRLLRQHGWWLKADPRTPKRGRTTYDASVIETLRALLGQPHREADPRSADWLTRYIEKGHT